MILVLIVNDQLTPDCVPFIHFQINEIMMQGLVSRSQFKSFKITTMNIW